MKWFSVEPSGWPVIRAGAHSAKLFDKGYFSCAVRLYPDRAPVREAGTANNVVGVRVPNPRQAMSINLE
jgi:hypothetical protein